MDVKEEEFEIKDSMGKLVVYDNGIAVTYTEDGGIKAQPGIALEILVKNPERYIEKGCLEACKKLWNLNICTVECEGSSEHSYIYLNKLSERNMEIFKNLARKDPLHYKLPKISNDSEEMINRGLISQGDKFPCCKIESDGEINPELINPFELQDMYEGISTLDDVMSRLYPKFDINDKGEIEMVGFIKTKEEAIKELVNKGYVYIAKEDTMYQSQFYLDRHLAYLDSRITDDGFKI